MNSDHITINPVFKAYIPALSAEEYAQLEQNIIADGCRDPLVVWDNGSEVVLIDGHNRHEICTKHDLRFYTTEAYFESENDAKVWVLRNQLGRRNLTDYQRVTLALMLKPVFKEKALENQSASGGPVRTKSDELENHVRTDDSVASLAGVGRGTVRNVETINTKGSEEVIQAVSDKKISINRAAQIAKLPKEEQAAEIGKPAQKKEQPPEDDGPSAEELLANAYEEKADREFIEKLINSDDKLVTAHAEIKRLNHELSAVKASRDGYMNGKNEVLSLLKKANSKIDRLEKSSKAAA